MAKPFGIQNILFPNGDQARLDGRLGASSSETSTDLTTGRSTAVSICVHPCPCHGYRQVRSCNHAGVMTVHGSAEAAGEHAAAPPMMELAGAFPDPVFVLCNGRSGSTLLRFLLDAHPELACPPETNLPALCAQLATVWSLIEGGPLSATRGDEPPDIPAAAIAGVRETMNRMVGSYLGRRGKKRYCDKSLGAARYAPLLARVYPRAQFVCVYRHPMDVIASGLEACPWGLNGYGFDPYIAATPGNMVMALASFWADSVRTTLAAEEQFPDQCVRVRYEDLVTDPEATAAGVFDFLGAAAAPGISQECFSAERERSGPADHKIWHTDRVSTQSVGRGWSVPAGMIAPQLLAAINEMAAKLGYLPVDGDWGTTAPPADLRVPTTPVQPEPDADPGSTASGGVSAATSLAPAAEPLSARLADQLRAGLTAPAGAPGGSFGSERFVAIAVTGDPARPAEYWLVDLGEATVTQAGEQAQEDSDWDIIGTLEAWTKVIDQQLNLSVAMRTCQLRYCDNGEPSPLAADTRVGILSQLLGLPTWTRLPG
jgi:Sulfotransferase family